MATKRTINRILGTAAVSAIALAGVACGSTSGTEAVSTRAKSTKASAELSFGSADSVDRSASGQPAKAIAADSARLTAAAQAARLGYLAAGSADALEHNATSSPSFRIPFRNLDTGD